MKVKEKLIKEKQSATQRPIANKHSDSTPLLMRLEREYLYHQNNGLKSERQQNNMKQNKQNKINMINSVPGSNSNQYSDRKNNIIKIDNYEGKRFKTQAGYVPEMTKSRYEAPSDLSSIDDNIMYSSQEKIVLRKDNGRTQKQINRYESIDLNTKNQYDRPLTFGLIKQADPLKSSIQYNEDRKMKNEALTQISELRKSQETLLGSKEYSSEVPRCANHLNKKAKYRLITEFEQKDYEQDMIYCSKCAINLLQRGFKVEQLKQHNSIADSMINQQQQRFGGPNRSNHSRLQNIRNFEQKLIQVEEKLNKNLEQASEYQVEIIGINKDISQTESVYDYLLDVLQQMKTLDLELLTSIKEKKTQIFQKVDRQLINELESLNSLKKQIKQSRNKYIIMKETEYQSTIQEYLSNVDTYGNYEHFYQDTHQLDYRKCEINEKVDRIMQSLWGYGKEIEKEDQHKSQLTSALKNQSQSALKDQPSKPEQEEFMCEQIGRPPFRTLFHDSDLQDYSQQLKTCENEVYEMKKKKQKSYGNRQDNTSSVHTSGFYENYPSSQSPSFKR